MKKKSKENQSNVLLNKHHHKQDQDWNGEANIYRLLKSPKDGKKYRIITPKNKTIDFGAEGYSDYTLHKDSKRMRFYVQRHGGVLPKQIKTITNLNEIHKQMLKIKISTKENWGKNGIDTAGFWSRWLLWSQPNIKNAKQFIETKFNIKIL